MNEWREAIWLGISAMIAALVLSFAGILGSFAHQQASIQNEEDNAIAIVKEYRKYNQYDNQVIYPQDVISAIADSRGLPEVWVDTVDGPATNFSWMWNPGTAPAQFSPTYLSGVFPVGGTYTASIIKDLNGAIIRLEMRRN
jgi:hypothetical protein